MITQRIQRLVTQLRPNARARKSGARHRAACLILEALESRCLLTTIPAGNIAAVNYNTNIEWLDTSANYVLIGDVHMSQGHILTVGAGVHVTTSGGKTLSISDDGTAAKILASGATFNVQLNIYSSTGGTLTQNVFNVAPRLDASAQSALIFSGNTLNAGVTVHPEFVPKLPNNTFAPGSTINVLNNRSINANTIWPVITNVNQYQITWTGEVGQYAQPVWVRNGAVLTIANGVTVNADDITLRYLSVADDGKSGKIIADNVTFNARVVLASSATGSITNSAFNQAFSASQPGPSGLTLGSNLFNQSAALDVSAAGNLNLTGNTFSAGASVHPELVPKLVNNTFGPSSTVSIFNNRAINTNTTWPLIPNVNQYQIIWTGEVGQYAQPVWVHNGAILTIASGVTVGADDPSLRYLAVADDGKSGKIVADNVTFNTRVALGSSVTGTITNSALNQAFSLGLPGTFGFTLSGNQFAKTPVLDVLASGNLNLTGNTFTAGASVHPELVPKLANNAFAPSSIVGILNNRSINTSTTWPVIANVNQYQIIWTSEVGQYAQPVWVRNGAVLTIAGGVTVSADDPSLRYLSVADDGKSGKIIADNVTFNTRVSLGSSATGTITNSFLNQAFSMGLPGTFGFTLSSNQFAKAPSLDVIASGNLNLTGNSFTAGVSVHPELVPKLINNTFGPSSTVGIFNNRSINTNTTWPVIANVNQYQIIWTNEVGQYAQPVWVRNGAVLTIASGVTVSADDPSLRYLSVADDGKSGKIIADQVTFSTRLVLGSSALGSITNSQLNIAFSAATPGNFGLTLGNDQFNVAPTLDIRASGNLNLTGNTFTAGVSVHPELVPKLINNLFGPNSTVNVLNNRSISTDTTWPLIPNVNQYQITWTGEAGQYAQPIWVRSGAVLTIVNGVTVTADDPSLRYLSISDDGKGSRLNATGVRFGTKITLGPASGGLIQYSVFDQLLTINGSTSATLQNNAIATAGVVAQGNSAQTIKLANNWWGPTDAAAIAQRITDHADSASLPTVIFQPFLNSDPSLLNRLIFRQPPAGGVAGIPLSPIVIDVEDADGNIVTSENSTITLSVASGPLGSSTGGTISVQAQNGVATFSNLTILSPLAGTFTLLAADGALGAITSSPFAVTLPPHLVFASVPGSLVAGATSPTVQVLIEDSTGQVITSNSSTITLSVGSGPLGGAIIGNLSVPAVNGVASFPGLSFHTAGSYILNASGSAITGISSGTLTVTSAPTANILIDQQPSNGTAGVPLSPTVALHLTDAYGNLVTAPVGVSFTIASGPGGAALGGGSGVTNGGAVSFSNLFFTKTGNYTITAHAGPVTATSDLFTITPGAAAKITFTQPPSTVIAGNFFTSPVTAAMADAYGNPITSDNSSTITLSLQTSPANGSIIGGLSQPVVNGIATFPDLSLQRAGTYTLKAANGTLSVLSTAFSVLAGAAAQIKFIDLPATAGAGQNLAPAPKVSILDQFGNLVASDHSSVHLAINSGPDNATIAGATTVAAVNGVATFSNLSLARTGTYTLTASDGLLGTASSNSFIVTAGPVAQLTFTHQPLFAFINTATVAPVTVQLSDQFGNPAITETSPVTLKIGTGPSGAALAGSLSVVPQDGVATFTGLLFSKSGLYKLQAADGAVVGNANSNLSVGTPANHLVILQQPGSAAAGHPASSFVVAIEDAQGHIVASDTSNVTVGLVSPNATLNGTLTVQAVNGTASFDDLSFTTAGAYTLKFTDGALTAATAKPLTITPDFATTHLEFSQLPGNGTVGKALAPALIVKAVDQYGNLLTTDHSKVSLSLANPTTGTFTGTAGVALANGLATFSN
ncbi:MAG TPA: hypothetical protein VHM90_03545, partial [Phycisphaerae bacterium]|nr:hypothetical protein [Phycisphaerae bacterium]